MEVIDLQLNFTGSDSLDIFLWQTSAQTTAFDSWEYVRVWFWQFKLWKWNGSFEVKHFLVKRAAVVLV